MKPNTSLDLLNLYEKRQVRIKKSANRLLRSDNQRVEKGIISIKPWKITISVKT
jgi:hypothetical protein